jgi:hypothetical protein
MNEMKEVKLVPIQKYDPELVALGVENPSEEFLDRFAISDETGSFVMKADAMPSRFDPHEIVFERMQDDLTRGPYGNREWYEEQAMLGLAHMLLGIGVPKPTTEILEDWIYKHLIERGDPNDSDVQRFISNYERNKAPGFTQQEDIGNERQDSGVRLEAVL